MKLLKDYGSFTIYEYDNDAKDFIRFLEENYSGRYGIDYFINDDDGSYKSFSGKYIEFNKDNFYLIAHDLLKLWQMKELLRK